MDSGDEIFLTQNSFTQITESKGGYDTDNLLNDVLEMEEATQNRPNFQLKINEIKDFSDDDLIQATLEVEENERKSRFSKPLTEKAMSDLVNEAVPKNTQKKSLWALNLLNLWLKERKITDNVFTMSNDKLCDVFGRFITEVKTRNGSDYHPNTLYEIIVSIQHYMRQNGKFISLLDDNEFAKLRQILDAKMKALAKTGLGSTKKQAKVISEEQEEEMWKKGVLGTNTPQKLINTLLYHFGLNFALRAGQEHRNLRVSDNPQITLKTADDGRKYIQYVEDVSKSNSGGLNSRKLGPKVARAYENRQDPERCVVRMFEKYMESR